MKWKIIVKEFIWIILALSIALASLYRSTHGFKLIFPASPLIPEYMNNIFKHWIGWLLLSSLFIDVLFIITTIRQFISKFKNRSQNIFLLVIVILQLIYTISYHLIASQGTIYPPLSQLQDQPPAVPFYLDPSNIAPLCYFLFQLFVLTFTWIKIAKQKNSPQ